MQAKIDANSRYCDAHFHLDLCADPSQIVAAIRGGDVMVFAMTNAPFVFDASVSLARASTRIVVGLGMHPQLVAQCLDQMPLFRDRLSKTRIVGEVGLDYQTPNPGERSIQRKVFREVLDACHEHGNKIVSIHSRRAARDVVAMLDTGFHGTAILHWFSGTLRDLHRAEDAGAFFSVNPVMIKSQLGRRLVEAMRQDRVLTETDGPYVASL